MKQSSAAGIVLRRNSDHRDSAGRFPSFFPGLSAFPGVSAALASGLTVAALLTASTPAHAQAAVAPTDNTTLTATPPPDASQPAPAAQTAPVINLSNKPDAKKRKQDAAKAPAPPPAKTADTKKPVPRYKQDNPLAGQDSNLPDKQLYDKAQDAIKHGRFDVARLDLQTLLNTYQDTQYMMRAKLAIADSWYKEGGTAALTQAEQEYRDFITFFPNQPEAAEAQMRIGDIYFREMDKPDRDHSKAVHAEEEYRLMLQQFPESVRGPEAAQRLREVQESLATAESDVAAFYATRLNWPAAIARYQTVADTYPLFSHMDDVLVGLGDAYEAEARVYRGLKLDEATKAKLVSIFENQAADAYRKVVLEHSASPHVEDARDRLAAMNLPIPTPTAEQASASAALENSRGTYTITNRLKVFVLHQTDTVPSATIGAPPLEDPKATYAPGVLKSFTTSIAAAVNPQAPSAPANTPVGPAPVAEAQPQTTPAAPAPAPLVLQDVAPVGAQQGPAINSVPADTSAPASTAGTGVGVQIVQPSVDRSSPEGSAAAPSSFPGLAPANTTPPPVEKAPAAPDTINDVIPGSQPAAQTPPTNGKKAPKPALDKDDSSSKKKPKKGLDKLNPF